jgi:hypothetical protein
VVDAPDAGTGGTVTLCEDDPPTTLFDLLGGTPDAGGTWTGPGGPSSGTFTPGVSQPGLYTYTVGGQPPCVAAVSTLAVLLDPCTGLLEGSFSALAWIGEDVHGDHHFIGASSLMQVRVLDPLGRSMTAILERCGDRLVLHLAGASPGKYIVVFSTDDRRQALSIQHSGSR